MADDNWLNNSRSPTRQIGFNDMNLKRLFLQSITSRYESFTFYTIDMWITEFAMQPRLYILSIISRINYQSNNLFDIPKELRDINGKLWHRRRGPFFSSNLIWRLWLLFLWHFYQDEVMVIKWAFTVPGSQGLLTCLFQVTINFNLSLKSTQYYFVSLLSSKIQ